jgi:hypothetical protein
MTMECAASKSPTTSEVYLGSRTTDRQLLGNFGILVGSDWFGFRRVGGCLEG